MNDEPKYSVDMVKEPNPDYGASKGETAITKETVKAEIDKVPEQHLEALLHFIKRFEGKRGALEGKDILESLRDIKIAGPKDFSQNIDLYLTGEKNIE